ncbi:MULTISPECIES: peptidoglycan-binding domain-containing protein [Pacificibacter]|uniref:peptidoglycan-binding domain-containing protein n=1 Tax=Pacificibacter TaxID=1042323 RepID=UPI001C09CA84|nr:MULTISPECIES: peptidoglycan-binding protein [Pacificibacter]MBU2937627.1 peptidoglycan-binding protein [Pacificibacter marinus]MDO6616922.1 peptidoglycan-binding protein [Pacificibacter sp. 1_MG-2023]
MDRAFPGATSVETRHVDVPSPNFPGLWQEGFIFGYFYQIFANDEAVLAESKSEPDWSIAITCVDEVCHRNVAGNPNEGTINIADLLASCLRDPNLSAEAVEQKLSLSERAVNTEGQTHALTQPLAISDVEDESEAIEQQDTEQEATEIEAVRPQGEDIEKAVTDPCGLAAIPEGTPGFTVQRLLTLAGADPGPIDGIIGGMTRAAISEVLGEPQETLDLSKVIVELNALLCR